MYFKFVLTNDTSKNPACKWFLITIVSVNKAYVVEINKDTLTAKISVEMFGRENEVNLNLDEIRKI